ncbi:glycosyltransferase family 2 protein [Blastococcus sp. Marseille-P5729]|uniref:glycosyltransferase family 2 protein n=1 Tax=Blastococcus sp. Marseille-P5729 TaxID=2086582 RepID=UPI000D0EE449|nr:glycosyltransferase family 2 protein [Blastococcus sp. Marseille-P5729]
MPFRHPRVTVVIVTWNQADLVCEAIRSVRRQTVPAHILVVDNASSDGTTDRIAAEHPDVHILRLASNTGFAGGVAVALEEVTTELVAFLNNDATADPSWLEASIAALDADPQAASVAARMLLTDQPDRVNNAGVVLLRSLYGADRGLGEINDSRFGSAVEVFAASGGAAVLRRLPVLAAGGIDPSYFMYYEDVDLGWRLRLAGWRAIYCPDAIVWHRHAASSKPGSATFALWTERNRLITLARNAPLDVFVQALGRFVLTTVSLGISSLRRGVPDVAVFSPSLRLRILAATLRRLPSTFATRPPSSRRREVLRRWRGVGSHELGGAT